MDKRHERELIENARAGNEESFRKLVEANMRRVYGLALRFTRRHEEADEIAQETFIKAYKALGRFRGNSSFGTWVYRIAVNNCLSRRRKAIRFQETEIGEDFHAQLPDTHSPSQERLAMGSQTRRLVGEALENLSNQQRMMFVMKHLQQKTIAEIAEIMGCAQGTVKQQLFRAVRRMREKLAPALGMEMVAK